jgi:hypothetical protein
VHQLHGIVGCMGTRTVRTDTWTVSDVMQLRPPVLKPESSVRKSFTVRSHPVWTPPNAPCQKTCESDVALEPSERPVLPFGRPMLNLLSTCYLSSPSG